jgi:hypothetical protein
VRASAAANKGLGEAISTSEAYPDRNKASRISSFLEFVEHKRRILLQPLELDSLGSCKNEGLLRVLAP